MSTETIQLSEVQWNHFQIVLKNSMKFNENNNNMSKGCVHWWFQLLYENKINEENISI